MRKILMQIPAIVAASLLLCSCAGLKQDDTNLTASNASKFDIRLVNSTMQPSSADAPQSEWPEGYELVVFAKPSKQGDGERIPLYVKTQTELGADIIKTANVMLEYQGAPAVQIKCTPEGAEKLQEFTSKICGENKKTNSKQMLAIIVDGKIIGTPIVESPLTDTLIIAGNFRMTDAMKIAKTITPEN